MHEMLIYVAINEVRTCGGFVLVLSEEPELFFSPVAKGGLHAL